MQHQIVPLDEWLKARKELLVKEKEFTYSDQIPTFQLNGPLIDMAAFKAHVGLYPMTAMLRTTFKKELSSHLSGKATARFPFENPIPYGLIGKIVRFKLKRLVKLEIPSVRTISERKWR